MNIYLTHAHANQIWQSGFNIQPTIKNTKVQPIMPVTYNVGNMTPVFYAGHNCNLCDYQMADQYDVTPPPTYWFFTVPTPPDPTLKPDPNDPNVSGGFQFVVPELTPEWTDAINSCVFTNESGTAIAKTTCPDCKGMKVYKGLFKTEPCAQCGGSGEV